MPFRLAHRINIELNGLMDEPQLKLTAWTRHGHGHVLEKSHALCLVFHGVPQF